MQAFQSDAGIGCSIGGGGGGGGGMVVVVVDVVGVASEHPGHTLLILSAKWA